MINSKQATLHLSKLAAAVSVALLSANVHAEQSDEKDAKDDSYQERLQIIGHNKQLRTEAGSATLISEMDLEQFEYDDINRVLAVVPGVNIREEDGYGLRPNIGFRGATPERSKKIALMEDGVLITPAPYAAPAAYYFPMVSRMTAVEVFKGPSAIKYGPNTVSGALNMTTRGVPDESEGGVDLAFGGDGYNKQHLFYGNTSDNFGFLVEGLHAQADGFKELDGGGDTGFDKNELMAKLRYNLDGSNYNQLFELKLSYSDETSDETYLGLTDSDFAANPNRRYAASSLGLMDWEHTQYQLTHHIEFVKFDIITRVYRNDFERSWRKLNGFQKQNNPATDRDLVDVLANPQAGINEIYYQVLTGLKDSEQGYENLVIGTNAREYYSQGIQSDLRYESRLWGMNSTFEAGVRYHQDEIERNHFEDVYRMTSGQLQSAGFNTTTATLNHESADVWSVYGQNTLEWDKWTITAGVRGEFIEAKYINRMAGVVDDWLDKSTHIWLPSFSAFYEYSETTGFLFGVHQGYVPTSPQQHPSVKSEKSINYEAGFRFADDNWRADVIGFFNDYENLKESCTFSTSTVCANATDQEYNGGEVDIYGIEATFGNTFALTKSIEMPVSVVYTFTESEFKQDFVSNFPLWGNVSAGDAVPYLPDHQLTLSFGLAADNWQVSLLARYIGQMSEAAGADVTLSGYETTSLTVVDLSASYELGNMGSLYFKVDNLFDKVEAVSHRPYGARPSKPQQFVAGYKYRF